MIRRIARVRVLPGGTQPNDPERAAQAIRRAVASDQLPLRLSLGKEAVDTIRQKLEHQLADLEECAELSTATELR